MNKDFFTPQERAALLMEIKALSDVDIVVYSRGTREPLYKDDFLSDRVAFFAKAKLWRVVQGIVRGVFLPALKARRLHFTDEHGNQYFLAGDEPEAGSTFDSAGKDEDNEEGYVEEQRQGSEVQ